MTDRVSFLLKIVKVELRDIVHDVELLESHYAERFRREEITNYVWRENRALLMRELACVREIAKDLNDWEPPPGEDFDTVMEALREHLYDIARERDYPGVVKVVIDRKLEKVRKYLI